MDRSMYSARRLSTGFILVISLCLSGCDLKGKLERWLNEETYNFNGIYSNQYNDDQLIFKEAKVLMKTNGDESVFPFSVDDTYLHIQIRHSTREKRPDIVMRIHGNGEVLTCSACAKYRLSNIWVKETPK
ncbi:hypothetical protein VA7868_00552 [Vibrio aerogenes CECT 7868]|uniref:Uncharacterized protein n=1 Tax=Vibrio aerogenes CECT 7868 TaxID=1216006 RepID=A0A1M5VYP6_9VIBR|nr:hypothetical protein [Vibrio aerogenes]SHH80114.1 hypothetical protein VA7868_00552 [Vibrio aerogenes CECT 7868]